MRFSRPFHTCTETCSTHWSGELRFQAVLFGYIVTVALMFVICVEWLLFDNSNSACCTFRRSRVPGYCRPLFALCNFFAFMWRLIWDFGIDSRLKWRKWRNTGWVGHVPIRSDRIHEAYLLSWSTTSPANSLWSCWAGVFGYLRGSPDVNGEPSTSFVFFEKH